MIKEVGGEIRKVLGRDPRVELLLTIPGVGPILAMVIALEIDEVERFPNSGKLAAYAGLVPSTYSSRGKTFHGKLLPMCNKWLRRALMEVA